MKKFITEIHITVAYVDDQNKTIRLEEQEWVYPTIDDDDTIVVSSITQSQLRDAESFLFEYEDRPELTRSVQERK